MSLYRVYLSSFLLFLYFNIKNIKNKIKKYIWYEFLLIFLIYFYFLKKNKIYEFLIFNIFKNKNLYFLSSLPIPNYYNLINHNFHCHHCCRPPTFTAILSLSSLPSLPHYWYLHCPYHLLYFCYHNHLHRTMSIIVIPPPYY